MIPGAATFEERIERLTERHEALTQSAAMMRPDSEKRERRIARLEDSGAA
jgi:hypothetical protein